MIDLDQTDAVLLERFTRVSCDEAFCRLVERYSPLVRGTCLRVLKNRADADDAAQATFIALAVKAKKVNANTGLSGWLHTVALQISLDLNRAEHRRFLRHQEAAHRQFLAETPVPAESLAPNLDSAIATLPAKLRETVIQHYLRGYSVEDIASTHGCSLSAITMRLTRARDLLRKRLIKSGVALSALSGAMIAEAASFTLPALKPAFGMDTARLALATLAGSASGEAIGIELLRLAQRGLRQLFFSKYKLAFSGAVAVVIVGVGMSVAKGQPEAGSTAPAATPAISPQSTSPVPAGSSPAQIRTVQQNQIPDPPLIAAIRKHPGYSFEECAEFKKLLDSQSGNINQIRDKGGRTALHWTAIRGWDDFAALLILRGADVNATDNLGYTPLFYAAKGSHKYLEELLILKGSHLNHVANDGTTPIVQSIRRKDPKNAELLLWAGASPKQIAETSADPLTEAQKIGDSETLQVVQDYLNYASPTLQNQPRVVPSFAKNSLQEAARRAEIEKLDLFLSRGINVDFPDEKGRTALVAALTSAQPDIVFYLLMLGANPNAADKNGTTPLMSTMGWLSGEMDAERRFLYIKGANPYAERKDGFTELTWAVERDNESGTQWLLWLDVNAALKTKRGTAFQIAYQGGHQRIIDLLRRYGFNEEIKPSTDPVWNLHNAAKRGDIKMLEEVLASGVPVDSPDKGGESPLMNAIFTRNLPAADVLIQHGADINYINPKNNHTPLYATMCWDYGEMTEFREKLLQWGVDPNVEDRQTQTTALMRGINHVPSPPIMQVIKYGADLNARDKEGLTALGRCLKDNLTETANYLREQGAKE